MGVIALKRNAFYRGGLAICLAAQLAIGAAQAGTPVVYEDDGRALFKLEVPDFWTLRTGGLRDLEGPDADDIRDVSRVHPHLAPHAAHLARHVALSRALHLVLEIVLANL